VADFHAANAERAERFPRGLLVTQTHDTKRSGDVRARIGALAGMAGEWREHVLRWRDVCAELRADGAPDANEEYLIYQTLAGAWPIERDRLEAYVEKALREAKRNTSWVEPDDDWESRVKRFAVALLSHEPFLEDFEPFAARVAEEGRRSALGQLLLKLTSPGVADIYQGDELEALSLVDPDNRRPVDWAARREALDALRRGAAPSPATMKLHVIRTALELRSRRPVAFAGAYEPVSAGAGVCAYLRGGDVLVVVPVRDWDGASIAGLAGRWRDVLGIGERDLADEVSVAELVAPYGIGLFERL
jgi:(1->4)-alpha-D-glucan 1-alpha-D-glucosylmutase